MEEDFRLYLEIDVNTPLKKQQKQEAVDRLINQLLSDGNKSVTLEDIYYIDKKSAAEIHTIAIVLAITASVFTVAQSAVSIWSELKKVKNTGVVFLKKKNGDYVKIDESMTTDDVLKKLKKDEKESRKES